MRDNIKSPTEKFSSICSFFGTIIIKLQICYLDKFISPQFINSFAELSKQSEIMTNTFLSFKKQRKTKFTLDMLECAQTALHGFHLNFNFKKRSISVSKIKTEKHYFYDDLLPMPVYIWGLYLRGLKKCALIFCAKHLYGINRLF